MIRTFCYSDIGGRACNEDAVGIKTAGEDQVLAVLADGLGGHGGGQHQLGTELPGKGKTAGGQRHGGFSQAV